MAYDPGLIYDGSTLKQQIFQIQLYNQILKQIQYLMVKMNNRLWEKAAAPAAFCLLNGTRRKAASGPETLLDKALLGLIDHFVFALPVVKSMNLTGWINCLLLGGRKQERTD